MVKELDIKTIDKDDVTSSVISIIVNKMHESNERLSFERYADHDSAESDPDGAYVDSADTAWGS